VRALLPILCALPVAAWAATPPTYTNPILYSDYSDPDVIRVGARYYMTASSFHFSPGLPILESRQWVGHGMNHMDLLSRPEVYEQIRNWLAS